MKLHTTKPNAVSSNVESQGTFKIKNSAKAFSILSSGLYSNKIRAIVRELSCNAVDSHIEAGQDKPFTVHLPNALEPFFSVTDYGIGLDHEGVTQIYTTYFESTKQDSNDYIGALGLGSKSPFSYTDNFTVTAIKDGTKRVYTAYIDDTGCPAIALMGNNETDEDNGVEVKFAVTETSDFYNFREEAEHIFKYFTNKPEVTGNTRYRHMHSEIKEYNISEKVHLEHGNSYYDRPKAIQGNIAYDIRLPSTEDYGDIAELLNCPLLIEFDIGELDVSASREELSYIPMTVNNIVARLRTIAKDIEAYVRKDLDKYKNQWDLAYRMISLHESKLFRTAIRSQVRVGKCKLLSFNATTSSHLSRNVEPRTFTQDYLEKRGISMRVFEIDPHWNGNVVREVKMDNNIEDKTGKLTKSHTLPFSKDTIFVLNDLKKGALSRVKYHFREERVKRRTTFVILDVAKEVYDTRDKLYANIFRKLSNPTVTKLYVSELREKDVLKQVRSSLLITHQREVYKNYDYTYQTKFKKVETDYELDPNKTYYYVPVSNYTPVNARNEKLPCFLETVWDKVKAAKLIPGNPSLYGVRKSAIDELLLRPNWINVFDLIPELVNNIETSVITNNIYTSVVDTTIINSYVASTDNITKLATDSPFRKFAEKAITAINTSIDAKIVSARKDLLAKYGNNTDFITADSAIRNEYATLFELYPMLRHTREHCTGSASSDHALAVINYINLIDNQRSNK